MSLQVLAQDMASRGRGPDTMLVHMAPREVAGLQALAKAHGGSLTTNPDTGLPEAGFLSSILPMIAGVGLTALSGGTLSPLMAGLITGGVTGVATGSLKKGLMAGLGAYGGAGLMGSVTGAGTGALSQAAGAQSVAAPGAAAVAPVEAIVPQYAPGALGSGTFDPLAADMFNVSGAGPVQGVASAPNPMFAPVAAPAAPVMAPNALTPEAARIGNIYAQEQAAQNAVAKQLATTTPMDTAKAGIEAIGKDPSKLFTKDNIKYGAAALAPTLLQEPKTTTAPSDSEQYRYSYNPNREMPPTRMGDVGEFQYFRPSYTRLAADGGLMDLPVERMSARNEAEAEMANGGQMYAAGGISHLGDYSDGGRLLKGPGDGVSDDIPATIANKRPARLADGEFVVPARIVSELGNGSTDAGARKLYAMMDRVQKNRNKTVGKGKVAVDSRSEKLLPA